MPNRKTRERQLAKLAARRAAERRRKRRQRILAGVVGGLVTVAGAGALLLFLTGGSPRTSPTAANRSATPSTPVNASPGANCGYTPTGALTREEGALPPPEFSIDVDKAYTATMVTSMGTIELELLPKVAPCTVNSFVYLAKKGFYDGVTFHRIVKDFVDQAGDPTGTGSGGPGYSFNDELDNDLTYEPGTLAMANSGANTNGSQFFIVVSEAGAAKLQHLYTIFGKVTKGMDVVERINNVPTEGTVVNPDKPKEPVTIETITIETS